MDCVSSKGKETKNYEKDLAICFVMDAFYLNILGPLRFTFCYILLYIPPLKLGSPHYWTEYRDPTLVLQGKSDTDSASSAFPQDSER